MKEITLELSAELLPSVSTTSLLDRVICPSTRQAQITISGEWYDFDLDITPTHGDEALEDLVDALDGTTVAVIECNVKFGATQAFYANWRVDSWSPETPVDGIMPYTITLSSVGAVTPTTTNADAGLIAVIADFFGASGVTEVGTALLTTGVTDAIEWTGSAYPESLSITMPYEGVVSISGVLQGSGALTKQASA